LPVCLKTTYPPNVFECVSFSHSRALHENFDRSAEVADNNAIRRYCYLAVWIEGIRSTPPNYASVAGFGKPNVLGFAVMIDPIISLSFLCDDENGPLLVGLEKSLFSFSTRRSCRFRLWQTRRSPAL